MNSNTTGEVTGYSKYNPEAKRRKKINHLEDIYPALPDAKYDIIYADPPYTEPLQGIQITIRCFEPQSGTIRQIRVVRNFNH